MTTYTHRLQTIQVFRGVAATLVLLFHATSVSRFYLKHDFLNGAFLFGYSGVDYFFVLSGFIIFLAHRGDIGRPGRVRRYFVRRFTRIYPLYWVVALILAPIYFGAPHHLGEFLILLKSFLLLPQAGNPVVTVAWSLTHEVFFYIIFGITICFPWRHVRPLLIAWLSVSTLFYVSSLVTAGTFTPPPHTGFVFSSYNLEFAMGCIAGHALGRYRSHGGFGLFITGASVFLVCGLSESFLYQHLGRRHSVLSYGLPSMLLVWGAALWEQRRPVAIPFLPLLLGDASYSIYLTHYALLDTFMRVLLALDIPAAIGPVSAVVVTIALSLSGGILFYLYVERPLLARLRKQSNVQQTTRCSVPE